MSTRRLFAVAMDALRAQVTSVQFLILLGLIGFATVTVNPAAMLPAGDAAVGGVQPYSNSIHALAQVFALGGLVFYTILIPLIAGSAVLRDDEAGVCELLHSTPLRAAEYIAGKYIGVSLLVVIAVALHVVVAMFWHEAGASFGAGIVHGPFAITNYLVPAIVFTLFGALFCGALAITVAEYARNTIALYALVTLLFAWSIVALMPAGTESRSALASAFAWVDLWGAHWLSTEVFTATRAMADLNHSALVFDTDFVRSRLLLTLGAVIALWMATRHRAAHMRGTAASGPRRHNGLVPAPNQQHTATTEPLATLRMQVRSPALWSCVMTIAATELRILCRQSAPYGFMVIAALLALEVVQGLRGPFDSAMMLGGGVVATATVEVLSLIGCVLLLVCLVEALDRARRRQLHDLVHATAVDNAALLLGAVVASACVLAAMLAAAMLAGLAMIAAQGKAPLAVVAFVWIWGVLLAPGFLLFGAFVATVYALTRQRTLVYAAGLLALLVTVVAHFGDGLGWLTNWPLWSVLVHSDFRALTQVDDVLVWNRALMLALAMTLALVAWRCYPRRDADRLKSRPWPGRTLYLVALVMLALIVWPAWMLATRISAGPDGRIATARAHDYWRLNVDTWQHAPPPIVRHMTINLVLEPARGEMQVVGEYLINADASASPPPWPVTVGAGFASIAWTIDGEPVVSRDRSGLHLIEPPPTAATTQRLGFRYHARLPAGERRNGARGNNFIRAESVLLDTLGPDFLPTPGFVAGIGVTRGNRTEARTLSDVEARATPAIGFARPFTSHVRIDVPDGYIANSIGTRSSATHASGRSTYTFDNREPVRALNVVAARWAVRTAPGVAAYFHPQHATHVDEMLATLVAARHWYGIWYAPYPWPELRVNEYAALITRAQGFATNLQLSEDMGFTSAALADERLPTIIVAHEAAHQWWGNMLTPAAAPGADVMIESMANHATLRLIEAEHGDAARRRFALQLESRYHERRRGGSERPLASIADTTSSADASAIYDKGALVLWMLERHLGRDAWQRGVHAFFAQHRNARALPTLADLLATLRAQASDQIAYDHFIAQWMYGTGLPEFQIRDARVLRDGANWILELTIANVGDVDATITLAASASTGRATRTMEIAARSSQHLHWTLGFQPTQWVVDPDVHVLQSNRKRARS